MFSFKKKDKERVGESKGERRERRKKEKDLKEKHKQEKKTDHLSDILAGFESEDIKKSRFSFRKSDKRKYDMDHGYDNTNPSPLLARMEYGSGGNRSDSSESAASNGPSQFSGSTPSLNSASSFTGRHQYPDPEEDRHGASVQNGNGYPSSGLPEGAKRPVPAPRRKKSSSIEIKLRPGNDSASPRPVVAGHFPEPAIDEMEGSPPVETPINSKPYEERRISASSKQTDIGEAAATAAKPRRVQANRESGVVEVKLINAGSKGAKVPRSGEKCVEIDKPVLVASTNDTFAAPPGEDMGDSRAKLVIPPGANIPINVTSPTEKSLEEMGVDLKLPEMKPAAPGVARVIRIKRRSSGDFGFALRRSTSPSGKTVHFVEPVGPSADTGLLPGDRLIEVNGKNIENEDREKIIEMIAISGNEVTIKVIPVPELSELSVRSGLDGSTVQLDESNVRAGTLARSGSKRMKKKVSGISLSSELWIGVHGVCVYFFNHIRSQCVPLASGQILARH